MNTALADSTEVRVHGFRVRRCAASRN